jgi:DNA-binding SARP family transcriptional activator
VSSGGPVRVHILGRVSAWRADTPILLGPSGRRAVLGMLALAGGRPLARAELIDSLWGDRPPASAANVIQTHVARLRRLLEPERAAHARSELLPAVGDGYALRVPADCLDLTRFRRLVAAAAEPDQQADPPGAAALLAAALQLWQEPPLADLPALAGHPKIVALAAERREALARYGEAMIAAGAATDAIPVLEAAAAADPLDEQGLARLLRAYVAAGRRARAVEFYGQARRRLADELGLDPGPELSEAYGLLLAGAPTAVQSRQSTVHSGQTTGRVPAQLPAGVPDFVGRTGELARLAELATSGNVLVLAGTAGVGKTALGLRWAHRARVRYPDGQLYVNLRGYDPARPMPAGDALGGFLRALGLSGTEIPDDEAERAAVFRTVLDGRRVLVFLDNAGSVEQVRPLLPGAPACQVVVTSRDSLAGLVAPDGARRLDLDQLPPADAVTLLRALVGGRVDAEPAAAAALADRCARLPLALRIAAELAATRPGAPLAALAEELADQRGRLDLFDAAGDPRGAVRAVFSWSYRWLPAPAARLFRLLGLHPAADYDTAAAAALAGLDVAAGRAALASLARAHLVHPAGPDRYGMHDLLRAYARELAGETEPEPDRIAALDRLLDGYLRRVTSAATAVYPGELGAAAGPSVVAGAEERDRARDWLDAEAATLVAVIGYAAEYGWPERAARLASTLFRYLDRSADLATGLAVHSHALGAARRGGDPAVAAKALIDLGVVHARQGRLGQAAEQFGQARVAYQGCGDRAGEARATFNLGNVLLVSGRYAEAAERYRDAIALHRLGGHHPVGEARALNSLGAVLTLLGEYGLAADQHRQALALHRRAGDRDGEGYGLNGLGEAYRGRGRYERAAELHREALDLFERTGNRDGLACSLTNLGDISLGTDAPADAAERHRRALELFEQTGNIGGQARARNGLGAAALALGTAGQAHTEYAAALALAERGGDRYQLARAYEGLAGCGDQADEHRGRAAALLAELGIGR